MASTVAVASALFSIFPAIGSAPAGASSSAPGVTAKTITVGIPYVDIAYVDKTFGLKLNQGSYPDAYNALFKELKKILDRSDSVREVGVGAVLHKELKLFPRAVHHRGDLQAFPIAKLFVEIHVRFGGALPRE